MDAELIGRLGQAALLDETAEPESRAGLDRFLGHLGRIVEEHDRVGERIQHEARCEPEQKLGGGQVVDRNKMRVVPGVTSKAMSVAIQYAPRAIVAPIVGSFYKKLGSG